MRTTTCFGIREPNDEAKRPEWNNLTTKYRELINFSRQEEDFTDGEIEEFHNISCGDFMKKWVALAGTRNVTSYVHMIGAGHLEYYLKNFRNLFKYSNQGWWEAASQ